MNVQSVQMLYLFVLVVLYIFARVVFKAMAPEGGYMEEKKLTRMEIIERRREFNINSYIGQVRRWATVYNWNGCGYELDDKRQYVEKLVAFIRETGYVGDLGAVKPNYDTLEDAYRAYQKDHPETWQETVKLIKSKRESGEWRIRYETQAQQDEYLAAIIEYVTDREYVGTHLEAEKKYILHEERRMAQGNKIDPIIAGAVAGAFFATGASAAQENMKRQKVQETVWREI